MGHIHTSDMPGKMLMYGKEAATENKR